MHIGTSSIVHDGAFHVAFTSLARVRWYFFLMCDEAFFLVRDDSFSMVTSPHSIMRDGAVFSMCDSASSRTRECRLFRTRQYLPSSALPESLIRISTLSDVALFPLRNGASFSCANAFFFLVCEALWTHSARDGTVAALILRHGASFLAHISAFPFMTEGAPFALARGALDPISVQWHPLSRVRRHPLSMCAMRQDSLSARRRRLLVPTRPSRSVLSHLVPHVEYPSHKRRHSSFTRNGTALVSDGAFTHCAPFLVWNILPMCDSTLLFTRDGATLVSDGTSLIVPPSSTFLFTRDGAALVSNGLHSLCPFLVWNILPMYDSTLLFMRDGAAFSLPIGPSLTVSFIVHNGGLLPSVTAPFISCVFLPRATVPSSRVQRKSSCVHDSTLPVPRESASFPYAMALSRLVHDAL
ncbi:hypothetical protein B0H13DRAFT_2303928 [Mycena leptocephala]|nr:hypothetical protein B0H13DRAFT_2303928 [Mycena leptocephala]